MDAVNVRKDFERPSLLGRTIDAKYVIEEELGVGAMGAVFRARHLALDRQVAVKVMSAELAKDPSFVERFHREARAASRLWHPNCVAVTDFGEAPDGLLYLVMELVPGKTLNVLIEKEFPLGERRVANILVQLLSAIAAAHDLGIIHRDLKPENLLVVPTVDDDGELTDLVKVCDFGLAKMFGAPGASEAAPPSQHSISRIEAAKDAQASRVTPSDKVTAFGLVLGTPAYMSPEQAMALPIEARSDIYAVGALLYEMLTKRVPFESESPEEVLRMHAHELPADPVEVEPSCSPDLGAICLQALEKEPMNRFPTARAMRSAVRRVGKRTSGMTSHFDELRPRGTDKASIMPASMTPESMPPPPATPVSLPPPAPSDPIIEQKVKALRQEGREAVTERARPRDRDLTKTTTPSARPAPSSNPPPPTSTKSGAAPDRTKIVAILGAVALVIAWFAFTRSDKKPESPTPDPTQTASVAPPPVPTQPTPSATANPSPNGNDPRPQPTPAPSPAPTPTQTAPPAPSPKPTATPAPAPQPRHHSTPPAPTSQPTAPPTATTQPTAEPTATATEAAPPPTQVAPPPPPDVPAPPSSAQ